MTPNFPAARFARRVKMLGFLVLPLLLNEKDKILPAARFARRVKMFGLPSISFTFELKGHHFPRGALRAPRENAGVS